MTLPRILCIVFMSLSWSVLAASQGKTAPEKAWNPVIKILNQKPAHEQTWPFSQELGEDLLSLNQQELRAIKDKWQPQADKTSRMKSAAAREETNQFFHREIKELNTKTLAAIEKAVKADASAKKDYRRIAEQVLTQVADNPVAKLENVQSYDQGGQIGFCFGRALLVHYLMLQAGVPQSDLAKIFVVGELIVERLLWKFHVAVMVRDSSAGYLVVDPLQKSPMAYQEWIESNARFDAKGRLSRARFYVTDPRKFLPSFGAYDRQQLEDPALKKYFDNLVHSITTAKP